MRAVDGPNGFAPIERFQENDMKVTTIALVLSACAAVATATSAFASSPAGASAGDRDAQPARQWTPADNAPKGKTRAQVRAELVHAQQDGQLAALSKLYRGG
jgi:hypothetical protein